MKNDTQQRIREEFNSIRDLVLLKNKEYGDSVINPIRIFSTADSLEQVKVRIDDKLSRLNNQGPKLIAEDTISDLIGYLVLLLIAKKKTVKISPKLFGYRWRLSLPFGWKLSVSNIKD